MKKTCQNVQQKLVPDPFLNLVNNPKQDYQKALKKFTLFFLSNTVPFNGQSYQKQKVLGTRDQSLFSLQNKVKKLPLLVRPSSII